MDSYANGESFTITPEMLRPVLEVALSGWVGKRKRRMWRTTVRIFADVGAIRGEGTETVTFVGKDGNVIAEFTDVEYYRMGQIYSGVGIEET